MLVSNFHIKNDPPKSEDLSQYSWHTGAQLRKIDPDEDCSVLFRDLGPLGMVDFLEGRLTRLAGPMTPLTYMRDRFYNEPYTDYGNIGRVIFLQPQKINPWFSGVDHVYVANSIDLPESSTLGFLPNESLNISDEELKLISNVNELAEYIGDYEELKRFKIDQLIELNKEHESHEKYAHPIRLKLQTGTYREKALTKEMLNKLGLNEDLLCRAFHHIRKDDRVSMMEKLVELNFVL